MTRPIALLHTLALLSDAEAAWLPAAVPATSNPLHESEAMTPLSPAAQAVLDAVNAAPHCGSGRIKAAAALRAAADQVVPETKAVDSDLDYGAWEQQQRTRAEFLAIAAELEGQP